jgi:hypothetical protein
MPEYLLTIRRSDDLDGPPLLASTDPDVLGAVLRVLTDKLRGRDRRQVLALARDSEGELDPDPGATP